jgi:transposase InsO family protein
VIVKPDTVVAWHRKGFRLFWTWKSRQRTGRPPVVPDVRALIRKVAQQNPLWGAPRIHGELLKLGVRVSQATVAKYMTRTATPPSQRWRTFLANHVQQIAAVDFFVVPTATYRLLLVLVILAHERRRIIHLAVTPHPTAAWTAQQFRNAFPWDQTPRYLIHDRDLGFQGLTSTAKAIGMEQVRTAPRSPWQNAYVERFIGSVRRELPGSRDRAHGRRAAPDFELLRGVLHELTDTPVARQGLARITSSVSTRRRRGRGHSARRRPSSPIRTSSRMISLARPGEPGSTAQTPSLLTARDRLPCTAHCRRVHEDARRGRF